MRRNSGVLTKDNSVNFSNEHNPESNAELQDSNANLSKRITETQTFKRTRHTYSVPIKDMRQPTSETEIKSQSSRGTFFQMFNRNGLMSVPKAQQSMETAKLNHTR